MWQTSQDVYTVHSVPPCRWGLGTGLCWRSPARPAPASPWLGCSTPTAATATARPPPPSPGWRPPARHAPVLKRFSKLTKVTNQSWTFFRLWCVFLSWVCYGGLQARPSCSLLVSPQSLLAGTADPCPHTARAATVTWQVSQSGSLFCRTLLSTEVSTPEPALSAGLPRHLPGPLLSRPRPPPPPLHHVPPRLTAWPQPLPSSVR